MCAYVDLSSSNQIDHTHSKYTIGSICKENSFETLSVSLSHSFWISVHACLYSFNQFWLVSRCTQIVLSKIGLKLWLGPFEQMGQMVKEQVPLMIISWLQRMSSKPSNSPNS